MENSVRICILISLIVFAVISDVCSQTYSSGGGGVYTQPSQQSQFSVQQQQQQQQPQNLECGIQDKDELPDMHAAAPWAAALFYVDGDLFQANRQQKYLNAAIFISRNMAITTGSTLLAQQQTELQTKLQLFYGNRASGKHTLIRVRKVEPLVAPRQPLALRVDGASSSSQNEPLELSSKSGKSYSKNHADLYLLHLESAIDVTPFSRPICVNSEIFRHRSQYYGTNRSTKKVYLSGYAAKNETAGPHVVYFSGDLEWRVQAWDTDNINLIMRDQQVSYGFLPKHFNPGSALIVKENHKFYLAGILLRSTESQTAVRSLEKYASTLESKGLDPPPAPALPQQSYQLPQQQPTYVPTQPPAPPSYGRPSYGTSQSQNGNNAIQYPSSQLQQQEQQQQQQTNVYNPNPSNGNQQYQSGTGAQITYLKEVEQSEFAQNQRTTSRTTSRPDPFYYTSSSRPNLSPVQQQQQQSQIQPPQQQQPSYQQPVYQNQNGGLYQNNPNQRQPISQPQVNSNSNSYLNQQSQSQQQPYYTTSSTQRPHRPQYVQQEPSYVQQINPQYSYPAEKLPRCSHEYLEGVDIECLTRQRGVSITDCVKNAPPNTKIRLSCKPFYVPYDGDKLLEKTCDSSGNWLPRKTFGCKLDCGNVDRTVPYIVHGLKTKSEQWPWHAALFKKVNGTTYTYICGATLISRNILITAAHCVQSYDQSDYSKFKVVVGAISSDLLSNRKDTQAQEFNVETIKINEHYNPRNFDADIALVQLDKPVLLSEYVRPVCFPFPSDDNKKITGYQLSEGNKGIVVGFGITEESRISESLRMASLPVVSVKNCTDVLERVPSSTQYCAGYTNGTGVCEGDSGGAQIFRDQISKRFYMQGIVSHGNRKETGARHSRCDNQKYTVFTKVDSFADWVRRVRDDLEYGFDRRRRR